MEQEGWSTCGGAPWLCYVASRPKGLVKTLSTGTGTTAETDFLLNGAWEQLSHCISWPLPLLITQFNTCVVFQASEITLTGRGTRGHVAQGVQTYSDRMNMSQRFNVQLRDHSQ